MNPLPILLLGGAALLMMGGKKKKSGAIADREIVLPPTTPPPLSKAVKKSGSGYPGVTRARMQEIQTMLLANGYDLGKWRADGRYGPATKAAVLAFQMDHMPKSDGWDEKPGPKTQAALEQVEAARLQGQQQQAKQQPQKKAQVVDECDPLDPGTWGSGNVCVLSDNRWVRQKARVAAPKTKDSAALTCDSGKQFVIPASKENWPDQAWDRWRFCDYGTRRPLKKFVPFSMSLEIYSKILQAQKSPYLFRDGMGGERRSADALIRVLYNGPIKSLEVGRIIAIAAEAAGLSTQIAVEINGAKTPATTAAIEGYGSDGKWGLQADLVLSGYFKQDLEAIMKESGENKRKHSPPDTWPNGPWYKGY